MKFHDYRSGNTLIKQWHQEGRVPFENDAQFAQWYLSNHPSDDPIAFRHAAFVTEWRKQGSPFYNLYPSVIDSLAKISLKFPGNLVLPPANLPNLYIRLPVSHRHCLSNPDRATKTLTPVRGLFVSFQPVNASVGSSNLIRGIVIGIDFNECVEGLPIFTLRIFPLDNRLVSESSDCLPVHDSFNQGLKTPLSTIDACINVAIGCCLLGNDPSIIEPVLLARDANKDQDLNTLIARARRRGVFGFNIGQNIETIPHIRRPHPALVWTGKGRVTPRIIFRKGSIVHRSIIEKIPTAYHNPPT